MILSNLVVSLEQQKPNLMIVVSFSVCSVRPASPFGNVSSSVGEDGAFISWEYWGPEKNVYVEYIVENSKHHQSISVC